MCDWDCLGNADINQKSKSLTDCIAKIDIGGSHGSYFLSYVFMVLLSVSTLFHSAEFISNSFNEFFDGGRTDIAFSEYNLCKRGFFAGECCKRNIMDLPGTLQNM